MPQVLSSTQPCGKRDLLSSTFPNLYSSANRTRDARMQKLRQIQIIPTSRTPFIQAAHLVTGHVPLYILLFKYLKLGQYLFFTSLLCMHVIYYIFNLLLSLPSDFYQKQFFHTDLCLSLLYSPIRFFK